MNQYQQLDDAIIRYLQSNPAFGPQHSEAIRDLARPQALRRSHDWPHTVEGHVDDIISERLQRLRRRGLAKYNHTSARWFLEAVT